MVSVNSEYYAAQGIASCRYGFENFEEIMPKDRFGNLMWAIAETKGYAYIESDKFLNWIMMVCGRENRRRDSILPSNCKFREVPELERRRANALNVEIGSPSPRCTQKSPDGLGLRWWLSGGSLLSYGVCDVRNCPEKRSGGYK
jgi:hypothetical protein